MIKRLFSRFNSNFAFGLIIFGLLLMVATSFPISITKIIDPSEIKLLQGHAYYVDILPEQLPQKILCRLFCLSSDSEFDNFESRLVILENDVPLAYPHNSYHQDIIDLGGGRYSHWGHIVYFSASDGSNPINNGKHYIVRYNAGVQKATSLFFLYLGWLALFLSNKSGQNNQTPPKPQDYGKKIKNLLLDSRVIFFTTIFVFLFYANSVFYQLLPIANAEPDTASYLQWSMFRTIGYPALLAFYHWAFGDYHYLHIWQLNFELLGIAVLSLAFAKLTKKYIYGWVLFILTVNVGSILVDAGEMLTESSFAALISLHMGFFCLYLARSGWRNALGAGLALCGAVLIKSVGTVLAIPALLFAVFLPQQRRGLILLVFLPAILGWLVPSLYNYSQNKVFESAIAGGWNLSGYIGWAIQPRVGGEVEAEEKMLAEAIKPEIDKRPAQFSTPQAYSEYVDNANLLYTIIVPKLSKFYDVCTKGDNLCSWIDGPCKPCMVKMNGTMAHLSKDAITQEPLWYIKHVAAHFYTMWHDAMISRDILSGAYRLSTIDLPTFFNDPNNKIYTKLIAPPAFPSNEDASNIRNKIDTSAAKVVDDFFTLHAFFNHIFYLFIQALTPLLLLIGLAASALLFWIKRLSNLYRLFCYSGLFINAYFMATALVQPAISRYTSVMQAIFSMFLILSSIIAIDLFQKIRTTKTNQKKD